MRHRHLPRGGDGMTPTEAWACVVSATSVLAIVFTLKKWWWAPIFGLVQEIPWVVFAVVSGGWPLIVAALAYSFAYGLAIRKWRRERT